MNSVGSHIKKIREGLKSRDKKYSLRKMAERLGVTPGYLSQVENGLELPSDDKLREIAKELNEDFSVLSILSGRLPDDLKEIVMKRPELFTQLIRELKSAPDHAILRIAREVRDGEW